MGDILQEGEANSHKEYFNNLLGKQEISEFVLEKINRNLKRIKGRNLSSIQVGVRVMPKRNMIQGLWIRASTVLNQLSNGKDINYV